MKLLVWKTDMGNIAIEASNDDVKNYRNIYECLEYAKKDIYRVFGQEGVDKLMSLL